MSAALSLRAAAGSVAVAALLFVSSAAADVCSSVAVGVPSQCYANRASCHYIPTTGQCASGAPANCSAYYFDSTGCTSGTYTCNVNSNSGLCQPTYSGGAVDYCNQQYTTQASCYAANCYWEPQTNACFNSLSASNSIYSCATWTSSSNCFNHGCNWFSNNNTCGNSQAGSAPYAAPVSFNQTVSYSNAAIQTNTVNYTVTVNYPLTLNTTAPVWNWIRLGDQFSTTVYQDAAANANSNTYGFTPAYCSSHDSTYGDQPAPVNLAAYGGVTIAQITTYIQNWIAANNNLDFSDNSNLGNAALALLGRRVDKGQVIQLTGVSLTNGILSVTYGWSLQAAVYYCANAGVTQTITTTNVAIAVPVGAVQMVPGLAAPAQTSTTFISSIATTGSTSISATSRYIPSLTLASARVAQNSCPAGSAQQTIGYELGYSNVYDTTVQVVPRSAADITVGTNCYGDSVTLYRFDGCSKYSCYAYLEITSQCTVLAADGSSFATCAATPAQAAQHPFSATPYSCPLGQPGSASCVVADAVTVLSSTVSLTAFPSQTTTASYAVTPGLLSSAQATSISAFTPLAALDPNNKQLLASQDFTPFIEMTSAAMQSGFDLQISIGNPAFAITPLNAVGNPLPACNGQTINYTTLYNANHTAGLAYVSKQQQVLTPAAAILPLVAADIMQHTRGFDGFAIPVGTLQSLTASVCGSPANGYSITIPYRYIIGDASLSSVHTYSHSPHNRRLLQAMPWASTSATATNGTAVFTFQIVNENSSSGSSMWGLSDGAAIAVAIILGIIAAAMLLIAGVLMVRCCRCRRGFAGGDDKMSLLADN